MKKFLINISLKTGLFSQTAASFAYSLLGVGIARAATNPLPGIDVTTAEGVRTTVLCSIAYWMFWFLIPLAIIFVLVAAYKYLTSAGDPEKVGESTKTLTFAAVAIVVALVARVFPLIIFSIFPSIVGASNTPAC